VHQTQVGNPGRAFTHLHQKSQIVVFKTYTHKTCLNKHKTGIKTRKKHRYNTISIYRNIFFPRNYTVVHLFYQVHLNIFRRTVKSLQYSCTVIDSGQKRFVVNIQLRECFARTRTKPFRLKKPDFVWILFKNSQVR